MTIQQLIAYLDAKRDRASKPFNTEIEEHPVHAFRDALMDAYDQLNRAAFAGEKLAEEVLRMEGPKIVWDEEKDIATIIDDAWRAQRNAALKAYKDAMGD